MKKDIYSELFLYKRKRLEQIKSLWCGELSFSHQMCNQVFPKSFHF